MAATTRGDQAQRESVPFRIRTADGDAIELTYSSPRAAAEHDEQAAGDSAVITTPTCPLRPLVRELPEAAEIDRGMWAGLVAVALRDADAADVECETRDCLDDHASCRVLLTSLKVRGS